MFPNQSMYFFYLLLGSPMANCICYLYDPHFSWNIVANCKFERKTRALSWQKKVMGAGRYTNVCPSEIISVLFLYLACIYISYTFNHPLTLVSDYLFWISYLFLLEKRTEDPREDLITEVPEKVSITAEPKEDTFRHWHHHVGYRGSDRGSSEN